MVLQVKKEKIRGEEADPDITRVPWMVFAVSAADRWKITENYYLYLVIIISINY